MVNADFLNEIKSLKISIASPQDILTWSYGEVTKAETINYRTFRSEPDGLFDERIFGPSKNYECYCGKYKKIRYKGIVCDKCGVEVTHKRVRRERMGHIKLVSPVTHVWYAHGIPNKLALMLNIPQKSLETVIYYTRYIVTSVDDAGKEEAIKKLKELREQEKEQFKNDLDAKIKEVADIYEEQAKGQKKEEKDKDKLAMKLEKQRGDEKKEVARVKAAFNKREKAIDDKFNDLDTVVESIVTGYTLTEEQKLLLDEYSLSFFTAGMGASAIKELLEKLDLKAEIADLKDQKGKTKSQAKLIKFMQRLKIIEGMNNSNVDPTWVVIDALPVLPPDLRPIIQLPGGRFATSDLNDLYRRVINRNNRLKRLINLGAPEIILRNERRMLQEAVDALLDNNHRPGAPTTDARGIPYKSLSDMLRGKQGRFRQNLLGKRVDYSARSVIVSGPELKMDQCGLPKVIALELFKPFIIRELIVRGLAANPAKARNLYDARISEIWDILEDVSKDRPVLLNRAPTLHKQGILAFYPILIEGNAIRLHPMVCKGFNADFDGDQMAVHLPLSKEAVEEIKDRMFAKSNMISMADGKPIVNTEKDMALGAYYLTLMEGDAENPKYAFGSDTEAIGKYYIDEVSLYEPIKVLLDGKIVVTTVGRILFNEALPTGFRFINETLNKKRIQEISAEIFAAHGPDIAVDTLDKIKDLGFKYATISGFSVAMEDFEFKSDEMVTRELGEFDIKEAELVKLYYEGMITEEELKRLKQEIWLDSAEQIQENTWDIASKSGSNMIHLNSSGATPVASWIKSIAGVKGVVVDPLGRVVDLPLRNNYKNGLNNFEYFVAARGTRKSFTDVALRTADSGYLTRKLVDVSQDVITREADCGTTDGIYLAKNAKRNLTFNEQLQSRFAAEDLVDPKTGEVIVKANEHINSEIAKSIANNDGIEKVKVRSPLGCKVAHGLCTKCYGIDYSTGREVEQGIAVGVIAAQALGEPSTQLTLKSKSDARANKSDVTQGLPRVQELIEVRMPKAKAVIADISGNVKFIETEKGVTIRLTALKKMKKTYPLEAGDEVMVKRGRTVKKDEVIIVKANKEEIRALHEGKIEADKDKVMLLIDKELEHEYEIEHANDIQVKDGEYVEAGKQLTYGSIYPRELISIVGFEASQKYIVNEIQSVYGIQGIAMDDKHLEIIVRQMCRYGQITDSGESTDILPGDFIDILDIEKQNEQLKQEGKRQIQFTRAILGITNAAIRTESFLSAASFQEQVRVLTEAALIGKVDLLRGLKENVIIGRPVPLGKFAKQYNN